MRYYVQFVAGTGALVEAALASIDAKAKVTYRDDSAMIFDASSRPEAIAAAPFWKNAFAVIASTPRGNLDRAIVRLAADAGKARFPADRRGLGFRVMVHVDGALQSVAPGPKRELERAISAVTRERVQLKGSCAEFWVVGRSDLDRYLLCKRLPRPRKSPRARGALSYELAATLVSASRPQPSDVFLDPFAGSGALVMARLDWPAREICYSDLRLDQFRADLPGQLTRARQVRLLSDDALELPQFGDGTVDVVVTDPPWGEFDDLRIPYPDFAKRLAASLGRVLARRQGRFVILSSRRTSPELEAALAEESFVLDTVIPVLVNGHPAKVLIGRRPGGHG